MVTLYLVVKIFQEPTNVPKKKKLCIRYDIKKKKTKINGLKT